MSDKDRIWPDEDERDPLFEEEVEVEVDEEDWEKIAEDPELASRVLRALDGLIPGVLKRATLQSLGSAILSEDGLRSILSDNKKIPKEVMGLVMSQADTMRREVLRIISREIRIFLENVDFGGEIAKILTSVSFEIKTEIRFIPNDQAVKPKIKNKVSARRADDGSKIPLDDDDLDDADEEARAQQTAHAAGEDNEDEDADERPQRRKRRWGRLRRSEKEEDDS